MKDTEELLGLVERQSEKSYARQENEAILQSQMSRSCSTGVWGCGKAIFPRLKWGLYVDMAIRFPEVERSCSGPGREQGSRAHDITGGTGNHSARTSPMASQQSRTRR